MMHVASLVCRTSFEHVSQIGTRESSWTRHEVGDRCADHGRKREPGDGHIWYRSFSGSEGVPSNNPEPEPNGLQDIVLPPRDMQPVVGVEARERKFEQGQSSV